MDEALARQVEAAVLARLNAPPALLIGEAPGETPGWRLVHGAPYEAVVIGSLEPGELLHFREPRVLEALLAGKPVFLWEPGLRHRAFSATACRPLWAKLQSAERELRQLGVRFYGGPAAKRRLVTAEQARTCLEQGRDVPAGAVLTPLARDILGGRT